MTEALAWGALTSSSLVLGALLGLARSWPARTIGLILAFGAGALISAVAFELAEEGLAVGDDWAVAIGLAAGAFTYFFAARAVEKRSSGGGSALAVGALLDGVPEQLVLGLGVALGGGVSSALVVAIFMSNLPEAIGSASDMKADGTPPEKIRRLWIIIALVCTGAAGIGYAVADSTSGNFEAGVNGFAAGALLVMMIDSMIPEATEKAGAYAGLVTVLGFALATSL